MIPSVVSTIVAQTAIKIRVIRSLSCLSFNWLRPSQLGPRPSALL
jgi:hypothetical protein